MARKHSDSPGPNGHWAFKQDQAVPATNRACPDCGARALNLPNVHARHCRHYVITELRNSVAVTTARPALDAASEAWRPGEPAPDYPHLCGRLYEALRGVLAEIDARAGA